MNTLDTYKYILDQLNEKFKNKSITVKSFKNNQELFNLIIDSTSFLSVDASFPERLYCIRNKIIERKMCPVCKKNPLKYSISLKRYYETGCCASCSKLNKNVLLKTKQTCLQRYGVESHNSLQSVKDKKIQTYLRKYNVTNPSYIPEVKEKRKQTSLKNNGVECILSLKSIRKKRKKISLTDSYKNFILNNEYDIPMFTLDEYLKRENEDEKFKFRCKKCGYEFEAYHHNGYHTKCPKCFKNGKSIDEYKISQFLKLLNIQFKRNERSFLYPLELDIYIPEKKLAIEYDGLYWHSLLEDKNYHLNKTKLCEEKGIQLIHIFENEWLTKQEIVKSRLKNLLGIYDKTIYARKCLIKEVDNDISIKFQDENHIQGSVNSKINLGLYFNDELVSLMTFSKPRFNKKYEYELVRFCSKLNYHVIGAAGKLLKYFEKTYQPKSIVSYADRRWSIGNLYEKIGFTLVYKSKPNYWYFKNLKLENRLKFQKHKLKNILEKFDENLSEYENMKSNGYNRIYDCGNLVYIKF